LSITRLSSTLSLHDALPILWSADGSLDGLFEGLTRQLLRLRSVARGAVHRRQRKDDVAIGHRARRRDAGEQARAGAARDGLQLRSEEHTSELQSRENLVCRL